VSLQTTSELSTAQLSLPVRLSPLQEVAIIDVRKEINFCRKVRPRRRRT
jgi:hypothetical protein